MVSETDTRKKHSGKALWETKITRSRWLDHLDDGEGFTIFQRNSDAFDRDVSLKRVEGDAGEG